MADAVVDSGDAARPSTPRPMVVAGGRALGGAAAIVVAATLTSKILGFLRDSVLADRFGATNKADAYNFAANLPLVLFAAVGVSITTVFIPLFAELLAKGNRSEAEAFAAKVNGAVTLVVAALILVMEAGAGVAIHLLVSSWTPAKQALTAGLVRIMAPLIMFYAWSAVVGGVLNVRGFFGPNAAMGIPQNLIIIAAILVAAGTGYRIAWVAWGSLVGTFTTYLIQLPALWRSRFRVSWRLDLSDPLLRRMVVLVGPAALIALAQQFGSVFVQVMSSRVGTGIVSDFLYANRVQVLGYTVLGMSLATVIYPSMASAAAVADMAGFRQTLMRGLGLINFVTIPVTGLMLILAQAVVRVLFQHGHFTHADTLNTAPILATLSLGTLFFAWQDYLDRGFFALQDTRVPMRGALIGVAVNVVLSYVLVGYLHQMGLGLAMAAGWMAAVTYLVINLRRRLGLLGGRQVVSSLLRMLAAAAVGFLAARWAYPHLVNVLGGDRWRNAAVSLVICGLGGTTVYVGICGLLRVGEVAEAQVMLRSLLGRFARTPV